MSKRKLYLDFDQTCVNSIKRVVELYNEDFANYPNFVPARWERVNQWDFKDECKLVSKKKCDSYFEDKRFFDDKLEFMDNGEEILKILSEKFDIYIISMGSKKNIRLKKAWIETNMPYIKGFIGCDFAKYKDKRHIIMGEDSVFVDDCYNNIANANCTLPILFGDIYEWNEKNELDEKCTEFIRCWNWKELHEFLMD